MRSARKTGRYCTRYDSGCQHDLVQERVGVVTNGLEVCKYRQMLFINVRRLLRSDIISRNTTKWLSVDNEPEGVDCAL
jgi:hypothetical protein